MTRRGLVIRLACCAGLCLSVAVAAHAAPPRLVGETPRADTGRWRVLFRTGRHLDVAAIEPSPDDPRWMRLVLSGGGAITVRVGDLRRVEELPPPPDSPRTSFVHPSDDPAIRRWNPLVERAASAHGLSPDLVRAVIAVESAGNPEAVSLKGAVGLMQLLPTTAADYGCTQLTDPEQNISAGCAHLARLKAKMGNDLDLVLAAYNAGEGAVERFGGVPQYTETRRYISAVKARL